MPPLSDAKGGSSCCKPPTLRIPTMPPTYSEMIAPTIPR